MNRSWRLFFASILSVAAYVGSYVYLVSAHSSTTIPFSGGDFGEYLPPRRPVVTQQFCYSQNPRVDSICNLVFLPVHYAAVKIGLQRAVYVSAEEQRQVIVFFVQAVR
jgi:hypothetical protein